MKRVTHKFEQYMIAEEAIQSVAFEYRLKYGRKPDIGLRSDNMYRTWRRMGMPIVSGGGDEPVYFYTMTFAGPTKLYEDQECDEFEFSVLVPDE